MRIQDFSNTAEFLATLSKDQLKEYAQNNAGNPYLVSLALFVSDQQKAMDRSKQAKVEPQGSVVDTAIANIAPMARATIPAEEVDFDMPEDSGIGQIPVDDTYFGANGGIIAFAEGGDAELEMQNDREGFRAAEQGRVNQFSPNAAPVAAPAPRIPAPTRTAALPSSKPLGIQGMFDEMKGNLAVKDSPFKSQLEALARSEQEAAKAETAGLEKIQEKYADVTKGQRARQDAKEKEIAAMDNQGIGIGLLLYGAELMSKRNPDAGVAVKGYLANRDRVVAARDKLSESRDRLEAAEAQRGELNATQLNKLRMNERRVGIAAQTEMLKAIQDEYKVDKDMALKILDLQIKDAIDLRGQERADRRTAMQIGAKDKAPAQQIFDRLLAQKGGDPVAAQQEYNRLFGDKNSPDKEYREALLKKKADVISGPLAGDKMGLAQIASIDAELAKMGGRGPTVATPSAAAIAALKANPNLAAEFDKKFNGTSAQYLR